MRKIIAGLFLIFISNYYLVCNAQSQAKIENTRKFYKDIPKEKNGRFVKGYNYIHQLELCLNLKSLENGSGSLQIRLWYGYAFSKKMQLIVFRKQKKVWMADFFELILNYDKNTDSMLCLAGYEKEEKSLFNHELFIKKVFNLGITTLPDMRQLTHYPEIADGDGVSVEVSNKNSYRFYVYQQPMLAKEKVKEAGQIEKIMELIDKEFNFQRFRKF